MPTCLKSVHNSFYIDLILTNKPNWFPNSGDYETYVSKFHEPTFTVFKTYVQRPRRKLSDTEIRLTSVIMN